MQDTQHYLVAHRQAIKVGRLLKLCARLLFRFIVYLFLPGSAYELDTAPHPVIVVLILCSSVFFLVDKLFIFVFTVR